MSHDSAMTITEFLEARISEDEAALDRRGTFPHGVHSSDAYGAYNPQCPDCLGLPGRNRTLAECAAKRAIIALFKPEDTTENADRDSAFYAAGIEHAIYALAAVYADHPDYRQEWAQ